ncbi:MAG: penicillin-binding protein 2 [Legionellales bacterium]|nr:penicillin-binding protein 2 [Legionellales bacterium]|tara:strand:- start:48435 stop:50207 length:1773 start_codon:yes stop_codon:yes gene_type:complete
MGGVVLFLSLCLFARLVYLQIIEHEHYQTLSKKNQLAFLPIPPKRGLIYDRNGVLIAQNMPVFTLELIPSQIANVDETITELQKLVDISPHELAVFQRLRKQTRRYDPVPLKLKLENSEVAKFYVNQFRFPGVFVQAQLIRYYPLGPAMANVLGYVGRINAYDLENIDQTQYVASNYIGKVGIEKYYERQLHGRVGYQQVETDASGQIVRVLERTQPKAGEDLTLTIDSNLQLAAQNALGDKRGAIIAINPNNGEILAMLSNPGYNSNLFVEGMSSLEYKALQDSPDQPLFNRALRGQYPLASTIKPFMALEGLLSKTITANDQIFDPGWYSVKHSSHKYRDWRKGGHGWVDVHKAIVVSCDTFFYDLASNMGIDKIDDILQKFGFGHATQIDMGEELAGLVPTPDWKKQHQGTPWYPGDTVISGIGQGYMLTTPLQLANATAILAKQGQGYQPHLLLKTTPADGKPVQQQPLALQKLNIPHRDWQTVIDAMVGVIKSPVGTGYRFGKTAPYSVAAKTGTAQLVSESSRAASDNVPTRLRDNSMFIAFAPVNKPQIAIAVVVENDPSAANVARKVMDQYFAHQSTGKPTA